jgi:hypothetical protein
MTIEPIAHALLLQSSSPTSPEGLEAARPGCSEKLQSVSAGASIGQDPKRKAGYPSGACVPYADTQFVRSRAANELSVVLPNALSHQNLGSGHSMSETVQAEIDGPGSARTLEEHICRDKAFSLIFPEWNATPSKEGQ